MLILKERKLYQNILCCILLLLSVFLSDIVLAAHYVITSTSTFKNTTFDNYSDDYGGAFYVDTTGVLIISSVTFINNKVTTAGGAIYNKGITKITNGISFISNSVIAEYGVSGGAIYNDRNSTMTITGKNIIFGYNTASVYGSGGAIFNDGNSTITGEDIEFISNTASGGDVAIGLGGAICNYSAMTITGDKIEFSSNTAHTRGGAICNVNATMVLMGCDINFSSNTVRCEEPRMHGGAIYNNNSTIAISGNNIFFNSNTAGYYGGTIYNYNSSTMTIIGENIVFNNNRASSIRGGAIYNDGSTLNLVSTGKIEFTGNIAKEVSNAIHDYCGTINLYASKNAQIIFNDRITSQNSNSVLNINQSTTTVNAVGKVILNEDMRGYTGQVNLYAGTVQIGQYGTWFAGNTYVDNATIDMANFVLQEHNFNALEVNNNLNLFVDVDLVNKQMDTITASEDSDIQGKINIKSINILEDATEDRTEKYYLQVPQYYKVK